MIHRALLGSMERFAGILIEHYGGRFPDWLAPTQAAILPVADRHVDAAAAMLGRADGELGVRARVDDAQRVGRPEDPRRRARQGALHARASATASSRPGEPRSAPTPTATSG